MKCHTFKDVKVNIILMCLSRNCFNSIRIPNHNISIRSRSNYTFLRIYVKDFCCGGAGYSYKSFWRHITTIHSIFPNNTHPFFNTINSIWNFSEIMQPHCLLLRIKGTMISTCTIQFASS
uniref:Uncharacterized protein n=1 Tax=Lepeophtheirus salmonis TaxID=72036 RepID=A0A0K2UMS2_LEPSM